MSPAQALSPTGFLQSDEYTLCNNSNDLCTNCTHKTPVPFSL